MFSLKQYFFNKIFKRLKGLFFEKKVNKIFKTII